ncbi:hypothetical protein Tco_0516180 [Tanacetum coccineum]
MSDSEDSTVTYMEVSSPFEDLSDIGSPGVDGLPMILEDPYVEAGIQAPLSLDYVPGPEHPPFPVYVTYVPETAYPEFIPPEDDVLPAEEQPLPAAISPTADSPGYITKSDLEEDSEEDNKDPEEDPADYPTNRDDGKEEEEEESSGDDADDKKENEDDKEEEDEDKEEEEEHLPPSNSIPPPVHHVTARISIRAQTRISLPSETEIHSLPLPVSPPLPISPPPQPASHTYPLGYRAPMIWLRAESPSTSHLLPLPSPIILLHTRESVAMMRAAAPSTYILAPRSRILPLETPPSGTPPLLPIPLPTPLPPLLLHSTDCRAGVTEVTLLPQKRLCIALGLRFEVSESSSAPTARPTRGFREDYGFVGTLMRLGETLRKRLSQRMIDFVMTVRQDTNEIYRRLDDAQDDRSPRNQENKNGENTRRVVPVEITTSNALVSCDGSGYDWSDQAEEEDDDVPQAKIKKKTFKPSFAKIEFVKPKGKTARKTAKHVEELRQNTHTPRGNQRN